MVGLSKYSDKERRQQRRRNHIARDLADRKYHQRIVPSEKLAADGCRKRKYINTDEAEGYYDDGDD